MTARIKMGLVHINKHYIQIMKLTRTTNVQWFRCDLKVVFLNTLEYKQNTYLQNPIWSVTMTRGLVF